MFSIFKDFHYFLTLRRYPQKGFFLEPIVFLIV